MAGPAGAGRARGGVPGALTAAALGAALVAAGPPSADLAAQAYRADLGLGVWHERWFGGHHLPGYSLLSPPLMALLGPVLAGALAAVALAAAGGALTRHRWAAAWLGVAAAAQLASGRVTFLVGAALGAAAVLLAARGRPGWGAGTAALAAAGSPVAGLFVALVAVAEGLWAASGGRGRAAGWAAVAAAPLAVVAGLAIAFPEGGEEPFVASAFWPALAMTAAVGWLAPRLRVVAALYAGALVLSFAVASPMGGNATRLGMLAAGPALLACARAPRPLLAALLAGAAWWVAYPAVRDVARAAGDPSTERAFHAPLLEELARRGGPPGRLEVPMTANHFEARWLAPAVPLARGWVRQLDVTRNPLFYAGGLDGPALRAWLDERAVRWVAVPLGVPLDAAGEAEAALVRRGAVPGTRLVFQTPDWELWEVVDPVPLADGARVVAVRDDGLVLDVPRPGTVVVRAHPSRWRAVTAGGACVLRDGGDRRVRLRVRVPGRVVLGAAARGGRCG